MLPMIGNRFAIPGTDTRSDYIRAGHPHWAMTQTQQYTISLLVVIYSVYIPISQQKLGTV